MLATTVIVLLDRSGKVTRGMTKSCESETFSHAERRGCILLREIE